MPNPSGSAPSAEKGAQDLEHENVRSIDLTPGTRLRDRRDGHIAVLERRKQRTDIAPHRTRPFHEGWWCVGGGGLADFVIDDPDTNWEVLP